MILLSLVLVIAAAVLLVVGWFQDGLSLIYLSIGACLLAMLLLGASVLMRRRDAPAPASRPTAPASATGPVTTTDAVGEPTAAGAGTTTTTRRTAVVRRPAEDTAADEVDDTVAATDAPDAGPADVADDASTGVAAPGEPADPLADIRGLGPNRRQALLERFGSLEAIRDAEVAELTEVPGVSPGLARAVKDHLA